MMNSEVSFLGSLNIENPNELTMIELAKERLNITDSKSKLVYFPMPCDDLKQRKPNIDLVFEKLNEWTPKTQLNEGLVKTIAYFYDLSTKF